MKKSKAKYAALAGVVLSAGILWLFVNCSGLKKS